MKEPTNFFTNYPTIPDGFDLVICSIFLPPVSRFFAYYGFLPEPPTLPSSSHSFLILAFYRFFASLTSRNNCAAYGT